MKHFLRAVGVLFLIVEASFVWGCGASTIDEQEALRLIREANGYPKSISTQAFNIRKESRLYAEMERLLAEGFLKDEGSSGFSPTEKGKELVEHAWGNRFGYGHEEWSAVDFSVFRADATRIIDQRVDPQSKEVTVNYEVTISTTPYLETLRQLDQQIITNSLERSKFMSHVVPGTSTKTAKFAKWEKGWKLTAN